MKRDIMELKETVDLMLSEDYKDRFKAEYYQLKNRYDKLHTMLSKYEAGVDFGVPDLYIGFTPKTPLATLKKQAIEMHDYLYSLEKRAAVENIEL